MPLFPPNFHIRKCFLIIFVPFFCQWHLSTIHRPMNKQTPWCTIHQPTTQTNTTHTSPLHKQTTHLWQSAPDIYTILSNLQYFQKIDLVIFKVNCDLFGGSTSKLEGLQGRKLNVTKMIAISSVLVRFSNFQIISWIVFRCQFYLFYASTWNLAYF